MTKTTTNETFIIRRELMLAQTELNAAQEDVALLERLRSAPERAKALAADVTRLTAILNKEEAAAEKAAAEARFAGLLDIQVAETKDSQGGGVLRSGFTITYTRSVWDTDAHKTSRRPSPASALPAWMTTFSRFSSKSIPSKYPPAL